jgi:hypothetical protein
LYHEIEIGLEGVASTQCKVADKPTYNTNAIEAHEMFIQQSPQKGSFRRRILPYEPVKPPLQDAAITRD